MYVSPYAQEVSEILYSREYAEKHKAVCKGINNFEGVIIMYFLK